MRNTTHTDAPQSASPMRSLGDERGLFLAEEAMALVLDATPRDHSARNRRLNTAQYIDALQQYDRYVPVQMIAAQHHVTTSRVYQIMRSRAETELAFADLDELRAGLSDDLDAGRIELSAANALLLLCAAADNESRRLALDTVLGVPHE